MKSNKIRQKFLRYFNQKMHLIIPSAPMVIKDDTTLMFTNAGMNQFKDIFLGNRMPESPRIANSQKCLRVSGKHNDLEEVGKDTYHHTMFEMLGNWSFGDYFKKEAIEWAWEFLVKVMKITPDRLYATFFKGNSEVERDDEAYELWKKHLPVERILEGDKNNNFWEMGEIGPCGPCSEIHIDIRPTHERKKLSGSNLINKNHPLVIEIWNLVFIQYNRKANKQLEKLSKKHIDTGMGFERLCMVMQGKTSNYDTDIFHPIIQEIEKISGLQYGNRNKEIDIAMRVIADHIRTIAFSITDGQLPSNNKAGYVIRRILRRAVRYGYTYLGFSEPFMYQLVPCLCNVMGTYYPELIKNKALIQRVMEEEEASFLHTLENGIKLLDEIINRSLKKNLHLIYGKDVFTLYDTYGFPIDLTQLIAQEKNFAVDISGFEKELEKQKKRSKQAAMFNTKDWLRIDEQEPGGFVGYDTLKSKIKILRYRKVETPKNIFYQLVFDKTPFYGESGGQVGDVGVIQSTDENILIVDTKTEHGLIIHIVKELPKNLNAEFDAIVDSKKRILTANNHSATHLLHYALKKILGNHVEQKGSLVNDKYLTFDFSHFKKMESSEISKVENVVNHIVRQNISLKEFRRINKEKAMKMGAVALFGEKYGNQVRVIKFGKSIELCGGTHVQTTGQIGIFKIVAENSIATGIRRIEAITSVEADRYIEEHINAVKSLEKTLKLNYKHLVSGVESLRLENKNLRKELQHYQKKALQQIKEELLEKIIPFDSFQLIAEIAPIVNPVYVKDIAFQLKREIPKLVLVLGNIGKEKAQLSIMLANELVEKYGLNAGKIIREAAKEINGSGGGQTFFASAGGSNPNGIEKAIDKAKKLIIDRIKNKSK